MFKKIYIFDKTSFLPKKDTIIEVRCYIEIGPIQTPGKLAKRLWKTRKWVHVPVCPEKMPPKRDIEVKRAT